MQGTTKQVPQEISEYRFVFFDGVWSQTAAGSNLWSIRDQIDQNQGKHVINYAPKAILVNNPIFKVRRSFAVRTYVR